MNTDTLFEHFKNVRVLIIGDVMIDEYVWGNATRISPEAPVPVVNVEKREMRLGGAANVALNIKNIGATAVLCGFVGNDYYGTQFYDLLQKENLIQQGILAVENRKTTVKTRIIAHHQQLLRIDAEQTDTVPHSAHQELFQFIKNSIRDIDVIIFEDYDKGALDGNFIQQVTQLAKTHHIPIVVDPKFRNFTAYKECTLFKPNLKELREGLHLNINPQDLTQLQNAVHTVQNILSCENVMITLSEHGVVIGNENIFYHIPAHVRKIADVSGAGDTVVSIVALCMALKLPLQKVAELSNLAGGLVCEEVGVVPVNVEKLKEETKKLFYNNIK